MRSDPLSIIFGDVAHEVTVSEGSWSVLVKRSSLNLAGKAKVRRRSSQRLRERLRRSMNMAQRMPRLLSEAWHPLLVLRSGAARAQDVGEMLTRAMPQRMQRLYKDYTKGILKAY